MDLLNYVSIKELDNTTGVDTSDLIAKNILLFESWSSQVRH